MSVPPAPQRPDHQPPAKRTSLSLLLALVLFTMMAIGLTLLIGGYFILIAFVIFCVTGLHYLLWGWWLGKMIREEGEGEDLDS